MLRQGRDDLDPGTNWRNKANKSQAHQRIKKETLAAHFHSKASVLSFKQNKQGETNMRQ